MYQPLLTRRYLFSKVMPLLAALAVALCTAMVLVVWSVMGGFLNTLLLQGRALIGDVSIEYPVTGQLRGIPHYEDLIQRLVEDELVASATPTVEALGLVALPTGDQKPVQVVGIDPATYAAVTDFQDRLYWKRLAEPVDGDAEELDLRLTLPEGYEDPALRMSVREQNGVSPAAVLGISVVGTNKRNPLGFFVPDPNYYMPRADVTITVLPLSAAGVPIEPVDRTFPVVNESYSGMYDADSKWVYVPLDTLQRMLKIDRAERLDPSWRPGSLTTDPETGEIIADEPRVIGVEPARASNILIRGEDGVDDQELLAAVKRIYAGFADEHTGAPSAALMEQIELIYTWERKPGLRQFVAAVKKETALVLVLFAFISLTAVFLVFAIFWAMISEKTKDVGILRAIGASRGGIAWLFLRYGAAIGIVGAALGGVIAALIVTNINAIHTWLGTALGIYVWDPTVYYFFDIPAEIEPDKFAIVLISGVLASVLGALVPALRAASMDPVKAIRFE